MKVRDLVQIEKVDEVVQIKNHIPEQIVETFVADERLEQHIAFLLERFLQRGEKNSFFILGSYGSGKSHLLAFIGDLLKYPELWDKVRNETIRSYAPRFRERRFFPIWIHLPSTTIDLKDYIWLELEEQLSDIRGERVTLAPGEYIKTAESQPHFLTFLKESGDSEEDPSERWEYLKSEKPEEALNVARDFFDSIGVIPKIGEEVESVMDRALQILKDKFGGSASIVLIIDELFDFLRGKEEGSAGFARDIAFLRDLGEASRNYDFFVLASLQEDILDPTRAGSEINNLNRISQRFDRLAIPYVNLQKVARERVLKKNHEQEEELRKLYSSLRREYFPSLQFDETAFVDLYPVHPFVLQIYEKVVREVGPRSLISFLSQSALKIQDEPYDTLVTISDLYDYLESDLATLVNFASYVRDIVPYYRSHIPHWFEDREVANWMEKAIKALVILNVAKEKATCKELAELILYRGISELTYEEFAHHMEKLYNMSSYLHHESGKGEEAIYILKTEGVDIEKLITVEASKIGDDAPNLWEIIRKSLEDKYHAPKGMERSGCSYKLDWRNTERKGWVRFVAEADASILEEVKEALTEDKELDFYLLVLRPNLPPDYLSEKELREEKILIWRPSNLGADELKLLKSKLAISHLLKTDLEEAVKRRLREKSNEASQRVDDLVEEIYFKKGNLSFLQPPLPSPFSNAMEESVKRLLDELYLEHPYFPRKIHRRMLKESMRCLAGLLPRDKTRIDYLEQLSEAGLLVKEGEEKYIVQEERGPYKVILDKLRESEAKIVNVWKVYEALRSRPYGLTAELVEFLILALVWKGLISVRGIAKEFFRQDIEELLGVNFISKDYGLKLLDIFVPPEVLELAKVILEREVEANTTEQKSVLWSDLRGKVGEYDIDQLESNLEGFHEPFNKALLLERLGTIRERIENFSRVIRENASPEEGFTKIYELIKNRFEEFKDALEVFKRLSQIGERREMVNREIDYLQQISLPEGDSLLNDRNAFLSELTGEKILDSSFLEKWLDRMESFKKEYIERYTALHEKTVGQRAKVGEELEELRRDPRLLCLGRIWEIMGEVGASNPAKLIEPKIDSILKQLCTRLYKDSLNHTPYCPHCRFNPANPPKLKEEIESLKEELEREWNATVEELRGKEEKLREEFAKGTSMAREKLESLLKGEPIEFNEEVVELLKRGLGKVEIYDMDLRPYIRDGGIYKPSDLLERIKKALEDLGKKGENIRVRIRLK
ncbi:hypothetical protein H5T88_02635 [bacterium]|nr:hypothetical protein [bacterium]